MARDNAELVHKAFDRAFVRRDIDAALELFDDEAVLDWSGSRAPYSGVYRGHAEIRTAFDGWTEAWEEWTPEIKEVIEVGADTVITVTLVSARGKGSGVPVRARGASVWRLRAGKIVHGTLLQSKEEALEAAN